PVFGKRLAVPAAADAGSTVPLATARHGPIGPSLHSRVMGSSPKFRSVASHWITRASGADGSATAGEILTAGAVTSTTTRRSGASPATGAASLSPAPLT